MKVHIGGVPEHFNYPWKFAEEIGMFNGLPFDIVWKDEPAGTGALSNQLDQGDLQMAVVLTEGIIRHIALGSKSKLLGSFVSSPLIWGIHVPVDSDIQSIHQMKGRRYAISRRGSGSHLMACVEAESRNEQISEEQWVITGGVEGAIQSFKEGSSDIFFWEKFMTKPYVAQGLLRRIGECITPWPCFALAINESFEKKHPDMAEMIVSKMNAACRMFMYLPDAPQIIAKKFNLSEEDARAWFFSTEWHCDQIFSRKTIENALHHLKASGLLEHTLEAREMVSGLTLLN